MRADNIGSTPMSGTTTTIYETDHFIENKQDAPYGVSNECLSKVSVAQLTVKLLSVKNTESRLRSSHLLKSGFGA